MKQKQSLLEDALDITIGSAVVVASIIIGAVIAGKKGVRVFRENKGKWKL